MEYNYSYNVLIERFKAFADGHYLIKRFTHGQIDLADMDNDEQYPFMHVTPDVIKPANGSITFGFHVMFADIPRDKETKAEYQREVISDCVRLAQDLIGEIKNGLTLFGYDVQMANEPTLEPFMEEYKNTLTGIAFTIELEVPYNWSACDIPANWTVGGSSSGGSGAQLGVVFKVNGVNNAVQNVLDLVAGAGITIVDNGDGSVTFTSTGGGGGGSGTVTSVGLTMPAAFSVAGSPVTTSGTLAVTGAGLSSQYIDGTGALQSFPAIPIAQGLQDVITTDAVLTQDNTIDCATYGLNITDTSNFQVDSTSKLNLNVNATSEVSLDANSVTMIENSTSVVSSVIVNPTNAQLSSSNGANNTAVSASPTALKVVTPNVTAASATVGQVLTLSNVNGTVEYATPVTGGDMFKSVYDLQNIGVVESAHKELVAVINKTGLTVTAGQIVYLKTTSSSGTHPEIVLATATTEVGSSKTIGAIWQNIANDAVGFVVTSGEVSNLDTSAYSIGDRLWLGTTAGSVTTTPPAEPNHAVFIGTVTRSQNVNGRVLYAIQNGYELNELHGVEITSEAANDLLMYDGGSSLWVNKTLSYLQSLLGTAMAVVTTNQNNVGTSFEDVTELSFPVTADKTYKWRATISFGVTSGTYLFSTNGPTTSINNARFTITTGATTSGVSNQTTYNSGTNVTGSSNGLATADGIFRVTASGTWTIRFRCSIAGNLTVRAGSVLEYSEVL